MFHFRGLSEQGRPEEFDELESAVRTYCRLFDRVFSRASGATIVDQEGRRYVDFLSGAGTLSYGHNNPRIKQAVIDYLQADGILHSLDLHTTAKLTFLRKFRDIILTPRGLDYRVQFCGPTGANAVEAALKLARKITGRRTIVAFTNAYHGVSLGALAVTASAQKRGAAGVPLEFVIRMPFDGYLSQEVDTMALLDAMLDRGGGIDEPAAIIVETVQAEGGINVASVEWLRRLSELARRRGILLIIDDIQVGCGRTGTFFSFERAGINPDIVCLSKAIGGIGMPMALVLVKPEFDIWRPGEHNGTFRGNNLAFVAGAAALDYWQDPAFEAALERCSSQIRQHLIQIAARYSDHSEGIRGVGLIQGIAWVDPALTVAILRKAFAGGLMIESCGANDNVIKVLPPLIINEDELKEGFSILSQAVDLAVREYLGTDVSRPMRVSKCEGAT